MFTVKTPFALKTSKSAVDYTVQTASRPVYIQPLNIYSSPVLTSGNSKLDKNVLIFDLLAVETCVNCSSCKASCYAIKAQRQYVGVYNKRMINTWLAFHAIDFLENKINEHLATSKKPYVRIHSAGDFINQDYINTWARIVKSNPSKKFYSYTKVDSIFDFSSLLENSNFNLVRSIVDGKRNYGTLEYITKLARQYNGRICPYGINDKRPVHCGGNCTICMEKQHVFFLQH